jgi:hypothetical protein
LKTLVELGFYRICGGLARKEIGPHMHFISLLTEICVRIIPNFTGFALESNTSFDEIFYRREAGQIANLGNRSGIICEKISVNTLKKIR